MKLKHTLAVAVLKLLAVAAMVCASAVGARAADRFSGGSFDGYDQCEAQWTTEFPIEPFKSRFRGGSFDGYDAVTANMAMRLLPTGTIFKFR